MPKRVIVTTIWTCSLCSTETDEEAKVAAYRLDDGETARSYDICTTCTVTEPFASFLAAGMSERVAGRRRKAQPELLPLDDGRIACDVCGDRFTPKGLGHHRTMTHNIKSATQKMREVRGTTGEFVCPEKGCGFRSTRPQGLGAHRRAVHGVPGANNQKEQR